MIRYTNEKSNGNFCSSTGESINDLIRDLGLLELPLIGRNYTSSNMRSSPTLERESHLEGGG